MSHVDSRLNRLKLNAEKAELLWAGSRHSAAVLGNKGPSAKLGQDTVVPSNHVGVLGVTFSSDLSLDDHVTRVSATCFYWLRQLRRVRRSLDDDAMKTLVRVFVTSRVHYCNAVLAGSPKSTTDTLQRVLNAAARLVSNTHKYDRGLSSLLHDHLHWLDVPEQVEYKLAVMVRRCLENKAPKYLSVHCTPVTAVSSRHLRSANQRQLTVQRCRKITHGRRAFSVAGPAVWNSLPTEFRDLSVSFDDFRCARKTILFARVSGEQNV